MRIENQLKLHKGIVPSVKEDKEIWMLGSFKYSVVDYELRKDETVVCLSNREAQVFSVLIKHANEILDRRK